MDLGAPIGAGQVGQNTTAPRGGFDQGEHGAGTGLAGGYGTATSANTQAGKLAEQERSGFNAGLGGEHASGGLPSHGNQGGSHPIADIYTSGSAGAYPSSGGNTGSGGLSGGKLDNSLDNYGGEGHQHHGHHGHSHGSDEPVSGAYAGGSADALTGQSHAQRTGAGVGPLGENTHSSSTSAGGRSEHAPSTGAGTAFGGAGVAGAGGAAVLGSSAAGGGHHHGTGVGAEGGAGGHYRGEGYDGERSTDAGRLAGAGAGAGAAGAGGAAAYGAGAGSGADTGVGSGGSTAGAKTGKYGTEESGFDRGAPVSDPKDLDTGGPHSLVFQESTGKYVHRRELEGGNH